MSNEIIKILDAVCDKFGIAIDWTAQNVMPQVEQICSHIVQYELWTSSLWIIFALIVLIIGTIICVKTLKKAHERSNGDMVFAMGLILVIIYLLFFHILIAKFSDVITALTFPEKTILDFITTYTQN